MSESTRRNDGLDARDVWVTGETRKKVLGGGGPERALLLLRVGSVAATRTLSRSGRDANGGRVLHDGGRLCRRER